MGPWLKSTRALRLVFIAFTLVVAWIGFQLGTHRHTGILRTLVKAKHFLNEASIPRNEQQHSASAPAEPQHSVNLSWKPSTSAVVGYNVYRRGPWGVVRVNSEPVTGTSYVRPYGAVGTDLLLCNQSGERQGNREYSFERDPSRHPSEVNSSDEAHQICEFKVPACPIVISWNPRSRLSSSL